MIILSACITCFWKYIHVLWHHAVVFFSTLSFKVTFLLIICDNILLMITLNPSIFTLYSPATVGKTRKWRQFIYILFNFVVPLPLLTLFCPYKYRMIIHLHLYCALWNCFVLCYNKNVKTYFVIKWYQDKWYGNRGLIKAHVWRLSYFI